LWADGFTEIFVDQVNADIVAVTRHNPTTHESVLLIAHTCFSEFKWTPKCRPIPIDDQISSIIFELKTVETPSTPATNGHIQNDINDNNFITGLPNFHVECYENVPLNKSDAIQITHAASDSEKTLINFKLFLSGSVVALKLVFKLLKYLRFFCCLFAELFQNK
jgi:glycogen debranching enzyme